MSPLAIASLTMPVAAEPAPAVAGSPTLTLQTTTGTLALQSDGIGFSQTWQVVTGSRALSTVYYNTTTKPIMAFVRLTCGPGEVQGAFVQVNGVNVGSNLTLKTGDNLYIKTTPNTWYPTNGGYPQTDYSSLTVWIDNQIVYQREGNSSYTFEKTF